MVWEVGKWGVIRLEEEEENMAWWFEGGREGGRGDDERAKAVGREVSARSREGQIFVGDGI